MSRSTLTKWPEQWAPQRRSKKPYFLDSCSARNSSRTPANTRLFKDALSGIGASKFDIAINTVGKVLKKPILEISEKEYDSMFDVNAKANFFFIQEAAKNLNDGGSIISIVTSLLGAFTGFYSTYQGSKAPVEWFTKAAAKE